MNIDNLRTIVSIARTRTEINEALAFCGRQYERNYGTHWVVPPDFFFVAKEDGEIVATGGLTFATRHNEITSERYFYLSGAMAQFCQAHRQRIVEFGRFASVKQLAAKAILHSVISYCTTEGFDFIFAWANPGVYKHTASRLGINFWPIAVELNLEGALSDSRWASPPTGFFVRDKPPALHLGVIPFWENVNMALAKECKDTTVLAW
ncbi:MAG: thermostable hemolysin [Sulfuriferula sp.]